MYKKIIKKAFTLVELLVVIAILAVLSAVAIIGYSSFTKRANISNDSSLIKELNDYVKALAITEKFETVDSVRASVSKDGIDLSKLTPFASKSGYHFGFNIKSKQFTYLDGVNIAEGFEMDGEKEDVFVLVKNNDDALDYATAGYSLYLQDGFDQNSLTIGSGVDVGVNDNISEITYKNSSNKSVVIRTNSANTTLNIDDSSEGTIYHYGSAGALHIIQCHTNSYHENGKIAFAEISKGRIVLESESDVTQIHVNKKENQESFDNVIISYDKSIDFDKVDLTRDEVEIASEGTLVVAIQAGTEESADKDYVWLTKQGIYEQIKVSDNSESAGSTWLNDSNKSEETKEAAKKIANNIGRNEETGEIDATVVVGETEYTVTIDPTTRDIVAKDSNNNVVETPAVVEAAQAEATEAGLSQDEKEETKNEVVETAQNEEEIEKAEESGFEITHHDALEPTCTEMGHSAYDSYYVNNEEVRVGYKEIEALGHDINTDTGVCNRCGEQIWVAKVNNVGYETFSSAWSVAQNKTLILLKDTTLNALQISGQYIIDLNDHKLTLRGHPDAGTTGGAIYIDGGANWVHGNLTIQNGSLDMPGTNFSTYGIYNYGTLTLTNVNISSACLTAIYVNGQAWGSTGTTTLDNVTITSTHSSGTAFAAYSLKNWAGTISPTVVIKDSNISGLYNSTMIYACNATVKDSTFTATNNDALWIMRSAMASGVTNTLTIQGNVTVNASSTFSALRAQDGNTIVAEAGTYNFDPTSYVDANSYNISENAGVYTVTAK